MVKEQFEAMQTETKAKSEDLNKQKIALKFLPTVDVFSTNVEYGIHKDGMELSIETQTIPHGLSGASLVGHTPLTESPLPNSLVGSYGGIPVPVQMKSAKMPSIAETQEEDYNEHS